jgi:hypothetical protein
MHSPRAREMKPKITPPETENMRVIDTAAKIFVNGDRYKGQTRAIEERINRA